MVRRSSSKAAESLIKASAGLGEVPESVPFDSSKKTETTYRQRRDHTTEVELKKLTGTPEFKQMQKRKAAGNGALLRWKQYQWLTCGVLVCMIVSVYLFGQALKAGSKAVDTEVDVSINETSQSTSQISAEAMRAQRHEDQGQKLKGGGLDAGIEAEGHNDPSRPTADSIEQENLILRMEHGIILKKLKALERLRSETQEERLQAEHEPENDLSSNWNWHSQLTKIFKANIITQLSRWHCAIAGLLALSAVACMMCIRLNEEVRNRRGLQAEKDQQKKSMEDFQAQNASLVLENAQLKTTIVQKAHDKESFQLFDTGLIDGDQQGHIKAYNQKEREQQTHEEEEAAATIARLQAENQSLAAENEGLNATISEQSQRLEAAESSATQVRQGIAHELETAKFQLSQAEAQNRELVEQIHQKEQEAHHKVSAVMDFMKTAKMSLSQKIQEQKEECEGLMKIISEHGLTPQKAEKLYK